MTTRARQILTILAAALLPVGAALSFWSYVAPTGNTVAAHHQDFTATAIGAPVKFSFVGQSYSFTAAAIEQINLAHLEADDEYNYDARDHFDSEEFTGGFVQIVRRRQQLNLLLSKAAPSTHDQLLAWNLLGFMLHAIQDFYAHSSYLELHNITSTVNPPIVGFGALTGTSTATPPPGFTPASGSVCPAPTAFPLLKPVKQLTTGYYTPVLAPTGKCEHGTLAQAVATCAVLLLPAPVPIQVQGISKDSPCALYTVGPLKSHFIAKALAIAETTDFVSSIVQDLDTAKNAAGFCALLGLSGAYPICNVVNTSLTAAPAALPGSGGNLALVATVLAKAGSTAGAPTGSVVFSDQNGPLVCSTSGTSTVAMVPGAQASTAECDTTLAQAPDQVTASAQPLPPYGASAYSIQVNALPSITLTATPTTVASGGTSTLTWSSTNATTCTANGWNGNSAISGSVSSGALTATATFSLTCAGPAGSATASVTVTVPGATGTYTITSGAGTVNPNPPEVWDFSGSTIAVTSATASTFNGQVSITSNGVLVSTTTLAPFNLSGAVPTMTGSAQEFSGDVTIGVMVTALSDTSMSGTIQYTDNSTRASTSWPFQAAPGGSSTGVQAVDIYSIPSPMISSSPISESDSTVMECGVTDNYTSSANPTLTGPAVADVSGAVTYPAMTVCKVNGQWISKTKTWNFTSNPAAASACGLSLPDSTVIATHNAGEPGSTAPSCSGSWLVDGSGTITFRSIGSWSGTDSGTSDYALPVDASMQSSSSSNWTLNLLTASGSYNTQDVSTGSEVLTPAPGGEGSLCALSSASYRSSGAINVSAISVSHLTIPVGQPPPAACQ